MIFKKKWTIKMNTKIGVIIFCLCCFASGVMVSNAVHVYAMGVGK